MISYNCMRICCRKADPFQGPKLGSCLTLRNELSEEIHVLTKQEILLGKGTRVEGSRVREPRRTALLLCHVAHSLRVYGDGVRFWVVSGQSSCLAQFGLTQGSSWWHWHLPAKMDSHVKDSGRLVGHIMCWWLLPPFGPSQILPVSFQQQHHLPYQDLLL